MAVKIRSSVPADVYQIRKVQRETWLRTYPNKKEGITLEDIEKKFKNDNTPAGKKKLEKGKQRYKNKNIHIWVAEDQAKIVGYCAAAKEKNNNRIGSIYLLPDYQGQGLGGLLIKQAFDWLGQDKDILLNVARYNQGTIGFYKRFGFTKTGKNVSDSAAQLPSGKSIPEVEMMLKASSD